MIYLIKKNKIKKQKNTIKHLEKLLKTYKKQLGNQQQANKGRKGKIKKLQKYVKNHKNVQKEFDKQLKHLEMQYTDLKALVQNLTVSRR